MLSGGPRRPKADHESKVNGFTPPHLNVAGKSIRSQKCTPSWLAAAEKREESIVGLELPVQSYSPKLDEVSQHRCSRLCRGCDRQDQVSMTLKERVTVIDLLEERMHQQCEPLALCCLCIA